MTRKAMLKDTGMPPNAANKKRLPNPPQRNDPVGAQIEQLPDRSGFLKFPSQTAWLRVSFPYFDVPKAAEPFITG